MPLESALSRTLTELVLRGQTASLDKLQALLVHLGCLFFADSDILPDTRQAKKDKLSSRRLEELRAYAGCFYVTSMMPPGSSVESMRYTVQLEEVYKTVAEAGGLQNDILLFHIRELETSKHELPENLKSHSLISINHSIAEINLYEAGLNDTDFTTSDCLEQLSIRNSCLTSVKSFLDDKLTQWIDFSIRAAYTTWVQIGHGILVAPKPRTCTCKANSWDRESGRAALNIQHTMNFLSIN
ncbi:hypothetical protein EAF00_003866 [Botryotinia globosa]|nr:hypothetical protein EAF00_003866 [Botryotinia globosa]